MGDAESSNNYRNTNTNRLFAIDEFLSDNAEAGEQEPSLSLSDDLQKILEERKLYSFSRLSRLPYASEYSKKQERVSHVDAWYSKKRRRPYSAPWSYVPAEREYEERYHMQREGKPEKMCLGVLKKPEIPIEKSTVNSILPLYLNATTSFEGSSQKKEFMKISENFLNRVEGIDYDSLTVQQLKSIMKEFGLSYTGKKQELIIRIQDTTAKIEKKQEEARQKREKKDEEEESKESLGFMFF